MTPARETMQDCLALIYKAIGETRQGRSEPATQALGIALITAAELPEEFRPGIRAALGCCALLIQSRKSSTAVTPEMRLEACALVDQSSGCDGVEPFQTVMFELLTELGEHQRAIPFGQAALAAKVEDREPVAIADWLWKIGRSYARLGLRDHAAIAYRASARVFRNETADPRLPAVLLGLGNSIRKSNPTEAEELYREAAAWWEKKGQLESATPAWMNLGIVCSEQQRFEEALNYYDRVRRVREASPGTPQVRIGVLYNNLAGCHRKMARFADAHQAIDRAIKILKGAGPLGPHDASALALAFGTKGMILRDEGRDLESIEWFRLASAELEKQPSPNVENLIEELEHEATALTRLNRKDEAATVEERIKRIREQAAETPSFSQDGEMPVGQADGALFIEVNAGIRSETTDGQIASLGSSLSEILKEAGTGHWQGLVRVPECSTLIFYGPNAQAMYEALESKLHGDSRFEGALVTIRQSAEQRELVIPCRFLN